MLYQHQHDELFKIRASWCVCTIVAAPTSSSQQDLATQAAAAACSMSVNHMSTYGPRWVSHTSHAVRYHATLQHIQKPTTQKCVRHPHLQSAQGVAPRSCTTSFCFSNLLRAGWAAAQLHSVQAAAKKNLPKLHSPNASAQLYTNPAKN